jgi:cold shock CspA family protein
VLIKDSENRKDMASGHISRLRFDEGYGFIVEDGGNNEVEFHWSAVTAGHFNQLVVGQRVAFDEQQDHRDETRTRAVNVRLMD